MSQRPLLLAYHAVGTWSPALAIPEQALRTQLSLLRRRGYVGLTAAEAERRRQERTLPPRTVVVTFDDGFRSVLRARPILEEAGFPATVFAVTSYVESGEPLGWPGLENRHGSLRGSDGDLQPLGWSDLELLRECGWEVGSHTVTHPLLPDVDDNRLEYELVASRLLLEQRLGSCETLSYPYGRTDERTVATAAHAGYLAAFTLSRVHRADGSYRRPRLGLRGIDRGLRLRAQLSSGAALLRRSRTAAAVSGLRRAVLPRPDWVPAKPETLRANRRRSTDPSQGALWTAVGPPKGAGRHASSNWSRRWRAR
jgi:peptidoglycan/xylan/chitin deacetylase (PgdA/CDA1 family)